MELKSSFVHRFCRQVSCWFCTGTTLFPNEYLNSIRFRLLECSRIEQSTYWKIKIDQNVSLWNKLEVIFFSKWLIQRNIIHLKLALMNLELWGWKVFSDACYYSPRHTRHRAEVVSSDRTALCCDRETSSSATIVETTA